MPQPLCQCGHDIFGYNSQDYGGRNLAAPHLWKYISCSHQKSCCLLGDFPIGHNPLWNPSPHPFPPVLGNTARFGQLPSFSPVSTQPPSLASEKYIPTLPSHRKVLMRSDSWCLAAFVLGQEAQKSLPTPGEIRNRNSWVGGGQSYLFIFLLLSSKKR